VESSDLAESAVADTPTGPSGTGPSGTGPSGATAADAIEPSDDEGAPHLTPRQMSVLVVAIFVAGLCSIVYELLIGTASSYFLGDSIQQFSITIGLFMAAMGLGSYLSRGLTDRALRQFVVVEIALAIIGGCSIPALYVLFAFTELYQPAMMLLIVVIGGLTGLEIPILVMMLRRQTTLKKNLSNVLSLDYLGALAATLLFPFVLLPMLGIFRSSLAVGLLNLVIALVVLRAFRDELEPAAHQSYVTWSALAGVALIGMFIGSPHLLKPWHNAVYEDRVVMVKETPYQKIVMTRGGDDVRLFLDGNLQFSSVDEYRYHEALVHPAMAAAPRRANVLVLGGGDGMAVREILKHADVERVTLVDLDPAMTELALNHPVLIQLNQRALEDARVTVVNDDAMLYLRAATERWDVIIGDLPDPNNTGLSRLYSREFFGLVKRRLAETGLFITQATSPMFARKAFWCIDASIRGAGMVTKPYHAYVPSFGDWGFVMASRHPVNVEGLHIEVPTRFLDDETVPRLFVFERDLRGGDVELSTLDEPKVLTYYLAGWKRWD
jgi:spermidine synthase